MRIEQKTDSPFLRQSLRQKFRLNQKGFSIAEVLVAAGLLSLLVTTITVAPSLVGDKSRKVKVYSTVENVRKTLMKTVMNDKSWNYSINDSANVELACLRNKTDCTGAKGVLRLWKTEDQLVFENKFDSKKPTDGFTNEGVPCNSFNASAGNDDCPIRPKVTFEALCSTSPCLDPPFQVNIQFLHKPSGMKVYPIERFNMTMYKTSLSTVGTLCELMGGEVDEETKKCELGFHIEEFQCPSGEAITSFDATTNEPNCSPVPEVPTADSWLMWEVALCQFNTGKGTAADKVYTQVYLFEDGSMKMKIKATAKNDEPVKWVKETAWVSASGTGTLTLDDVNGNPIELKVDKDANPGLQVTWEGSQEGSNTCKGWWKEDWGTSLPVL